VIARSLRYLPAALLVATALTQIRLARSAGLSPWLGGGFGMFSTTDTWSRRHLHLWARSPGVRREVDVPPELARLVRRALALPTPAHLRALALAAAGEATAMDEPIEAVDIEVWAPRFDRDTLAPSSVLLAALEVPLGAP
jgi:hypothetical protein